MTEDRLDRLERLFKAAQLHAPEERAAFLDAACADDPALRRELDALLQADHQAEAEAFLQDPHHLLESGETHDDGMEGRRVGPYVVQRRLGRGGMGDVYLAVREQPFKQYVALKIIRRGMDTREVVARFAVERQILAALNHPNIARLLDGGVTGDGLPYFAMEYVDGRPITVYCDEHRLPLRERLRLFQTVCQTVQYAHRNLVIHRDLKPSNILVTEGGIVKLLDFGIAKLLNPHLSPVAMPVTRTELRLMTPEYASPEQVRGEPLTTAADVYALGVILYELLTGHRPYQVAGRSTQEIIDIVCEQEPERPSTRISKAETLTRPDGTKKRITPDAVSATRGMPVARLQRQIRGDLDNIALMALRKEPGRRYGSAEQLGQDVERYLSGMPVDARPSTLWYRMRKFSRRHRTSVLAATFVLVSLVGGLAAALWQAREAQRERDRTEQALARSETVTSFLMELFEANNPSASKGAEVTARELLERGVARAEALHEQPELQAHLLEVVGRVYESLGHYERAETLLERALRLRRETLGEHHLLATESMTYLAAVLNRRGRYEEAERLLRRALAIQETLLDGPHPSRAHTLQQLGHLLPYLGKVQEAEAVRRDALALRRSLLGNEHPLVANSLISLGALLRAQGRYDEAEALLREALAMHRRTQEETHPDVTNSLFQLSILLSQKGEYDEAEALLRRAIDLHRRLDGERSPTVASYLFKLGEVLHRKGDAAEAEDLLRRALALLQQVLGDHPTTSGGIAYLASFLHERGALEEADSLYRKALSMQQRLLGTEHQGVAVVLRDWGRLHMERGQYQEAESLLTRAYAMHLSTNGPDHHHVGEALADLALLHQHRGHMEKADSLYREALTILRRHHRDEHIDVQEVVRALSHLYEAWGKPNEAARYQALLTPPAAQR